MKSIYLLFLATTFILGTTSDVTGDKIESLIEESLNAKPTAVDQSEDIQLMDNPESLEKELSQKYSRIYKESLSKNENLPLQNENDAKSPVIEGENMSPEFQDQMSEGNNSSNQDDMNGMSQELGQETQSPVLASSQDNQSNLVQNESDFQNLSQNQSVSQSPKAMDNGLQSNLQEGLVEGQSAQLSEKIVEQSNPLANSQVNLEASPAQMLDNEGTLDNVDGSVKNDQEALEEMNEMLNPSTPTQDLDEDQKDNQDVSELDMFNSQIEASKDEFEKTQLDDQSPTNDFENQMNEDGNDFQNPNEVLSEKSVLDQATPLDQNEFSQTMNEMGEKKSNEHQSQDHHSADHQSPELSQTMDIENEVQSTLNQNETLQEIDENQIDDSKPMETPDELENDLIQDVQEATSASNIVNEQTVQEASPVNDLEEPVTVDHQDQDLDTHEASVHSETHDVDQNLQTDQLAQEETSHKSNVNEVAETTSEHQEPMTDDMEGITS